ncbi:MAG: CPBP family glutamic-type intramembrane protease [Actinomycetota bacterium]|nr:CPBP family glutamic-type intramembrane protease [Actinomycetota bacterium]
MWRQEGRIGLAREVLPPQMHGYDRLSDHPVLSSMLIAILAGLLLRLSRIIELSERLDSVFPSLYVPVRLTDFVFRMTMGAVLVFVAVPVIFGYSRKTGWLRRYLELMRFSMGDDPKTTVVAAALSFVGFIVVLVASAASAGVFFFNSSVLVEGDNWLILLAALIPGIWEELAFRGVVLSNLQHRFSPWGAIMTSSVVFGLFHFSNLGSWDDPASVVAGAVAATALGIGWGYVVVRTNSIVPSMILHYLIDVILYDELFIDPGASDDSTAIVYVSVVFLFPVLTILTTRLLLTNRSESRARN